MGEITLTLGLVTIVDDEDVAELSKHAWYAKARRTGQFVAVRNASGKPHRDIYMSRQITGAPRGTDVDHANRNTLDNRRRNLRVCARTLNSANRAKAAGTTSIYKGVCLARSGRWQAQLKHHRVNTFLGAFIDEADAALAYDRAARKHFGEFARLNFPKRNERGALVGGAK